VSRLTSLIAARVYEHSMLQELHKYSSVPVVCVYFNN
jgi:ornithine carbamoyltransferase